MSDLYERIVSERAGLSNIVSRIPGFKGYQDRNARRTADRMLRENIVDEIQHAIRQFNHLENRILDSGGLASMSKTRNVKSKLQSYSDRIGAAAPGYAGLWASVKIDSEELEKLYSFDQAQFYYVDRINTAVTRVDQATRGNDDLDESLDSLYELVEEAIAAFQLREDVILGLRKSE